MNTINSKYNELFNDIHYLIQTYTKPKGTEDDANLIANNIWLGNFRVAHDIFFIKKNSINCIINATKNIPNKFAFTENYSLHMRDQDACNKNLINMLNKGADIIDRSIRDGKIMLVHCKRGHHRSAAIIVFYLMKYHNMNLYDAVKLIKIKRPTSFRRITCLLRTLIEFEIYNNLKIENY